MRGLIVLGVIALAACSNGPSTSAQPRVGFLDFDGAVLPSADSLAKLYATPALVDRIPMPPLPVSRKMMRSSVDVLLSVDEHGRVTHVSMTPPKDSAYARKWASIWRQVRFTPAKTGEGAATKGYAKIHFEF